MNKIPGAEQQSSGAVDRAAAAWLVRLEEGEVSGTEWEAFSRWVEADTEHHNAFEKMRTVWELVTPEALEQSEHAAPRVPVATPEISRTFFGLRSLAAAASIVLALGLAFTMLSQRPAEISFATASSIKEIELEDGSRVVLDAETRMSVAMTPERRDVFLAYGRARFHVEKDPGRPFTVYAGGIEAGALGTVFDVTRRDGNISVSIVEGEVAVSGDTPASGRFRHVAGAGEEVRWHPAHPPEVRAFTDGERDSTWVDGFLVFSGEPLELAVRQVNRHSDSHVTLPAGMDPDTPIYGVFRAGDTASFTRALESPSH